VILGHEDAQAARAGDLPLRARRPGGAARIRLAHERDGELENAAFAPNSYGPSAALACAPQSATTAMLSNRDAILRMAASRTDPVILSAAPRRSTCSDKLSQLRLSIPRPFRVAVRHFVRAERSSLWNIDKRLMEYWKRRRRCAQLLEN
jgi:hypothetical protein